MLRWNDIRHIRKTIWKGTYQVSHLLTVFSSSANFYIYIAKVAKKIVLLKSQMCVTCHSRLMYQNIYIFSTAIPVLKAKRLLRQLRLFSWPTMVLIAFPSQVWVFSSFMCSLSTMILWYLSQSWNIDAGVHPRFSCEDWRGKDGDDRRLGIRTRIRMWLSSSALNLGLTMQILVKMKRIIILNSNVLVNFVFPCVFFWAPVNRSWYQKSNQIFKSLKDV